MKVLVPRNARMPELAIDGVEVAVYDPFADWEDEHLDAEVLVSWANSTPRLEDAARRMPRLRLVQSLSAGVDQHLAAGFAPEVAICSGVGLHDGPVAEHALALVLAAARQIPGSVRAQQERRWRGELVPWQANPANGFSTLKGARVLVWGFGSIGQTLAPYLRMLGADVVGAAHSAGERSGFPVVGEDGLDAELAAADAVVMILPGGPETARVLDARRLALLKPTAWVVNVGRGTSVDQDALLAALREERLAGAALDVTDPEPLPADSPLWEEPRLLITPHIAGGRPQGSDRLVTDNLLALREDAPLRNLVPRA